MSKVLERLQSLPIFLDFSDKDWRGLDLLWDIRQVAEDEILWLQGELASEMAFLLDGVLCVQINGQSLATVPKNELVGELAVFTQDVRSATISAEIESELLIVSAENFEIMRDSHPKAYDCLLDISLTRLAIRTHSMNRKITQISQGTDLAPERHEANVFSQIWKKITGLENKRPPSAIEAVKKLPKIKKAHPIDIKTIVSMMTPKLIPKGTPVVLEGEIGNTCHLLVEGCVEVYRNVRGGKAQLLALLYPGALLGTGALLLKERRNASCVASKNTDVWVYEMDRKSFHGLQGSAGRLWREALLHSLAFQLRVADETMVKLEQGERPVSTDYDQVRKSLTGFQG